MGELEDDLGEHSGFEATDERLNEQWKKVWRELNYGSAEVDTQELGIYADGTRVNRNI